MGVFSMKCHYQVKVYGSCYFFQEDSLGGVEPGRHGARGADRRGREGEWKCCHSGHTAAGRDLAEGAQAEGGLHPSGRGC